MNLRQHQLLLRAAARDGIRSFDHLPSPVEPYEELAALAQVVLKLATLVGIEHDPRPRLHVAGPYDRDSDKRAPAFVSATCKGEHCHCGAPAVRKVGEEIAVDDPHPYRHNLTSYVCPKHYIELMGPAAEQQLYAPQDSDQ